MNKNKLIEAGINYSEGVKRFVDNEALYKKYLTKFPMESTFSELQAAMEKEDFQEAFRAAHSLKGIIGNLSFDGFFEGMKLFVELLRANEQDKAKEIFPSLREDYANITAAINEYLD